MAKHPDKGLLGKECYRAVCTTSPATWYNHSTCMYYCKSCAMLINNVNYHDAMAMFGHELCTRVDIEEQNRLRDLGEDSNHIA